MTYGTHTGTRRWLDRLSPPARDTQQCQGEHQVTHRSRGPPKSEDATQERSPETPIDGLKRAMKGIRSWPSFMFNRVWYRN